MVKEFTVYGEPVAKGRPRFSINRKRGYVTTRTPEKTVMYENLVRLEFHNQCGGEQFPEKAMLKMHVKAYFGIPTSASKKNKEMMISEQIRPTKKPDADNILKAVADALNTVAYHDDSSIVHASIDKYYSEKPRVEIRIEEV